MDDKNMDIKCCLCKNKIKHNQCAILISIDKNKQIPEKYYCLKCSNIFQKQLINKEDDKE
jgi:hypothetical protein